MATVTINSGTSYQTMKGWLAGGNTGYSDQIATVGNYSDAVKDLCVDLGITRLQFGIMSGLIENNYDYFQDFIDDNTDASGSTPASWQAVKDNRRVPVDDNDPSPDPNTINPSGFQFTHIDWMWDNEIIPYKAKVEARGEQFTCVAVYTHFSTTDQWHIDNPDEYGELILAVWQHLQSRYGFVPDGLEILLEPDNGAVGATASELAAMIIAARDRLVGAGFAKPEIICPSTTQGPNGRTYYLNIKSANATAASYIDTISYHRYVNIDNTLLNNLRVTADADGKGTAMTEMGGTSNSGGYFKHLHNDLKIGHNNSWAQYVLGYRNSSDDGWQHYWVQYPSYTINESNRTKYLRHYFQFIRPGAVMKGTTDSDGTNFNSVAFENANGTYVVVINAATSGAVSVENLPPGTYGIKYTTGDGINTPTAYNQSLGTQDVVTEGVDTVDFTMPGAGVVTIFDINYLTPAGLPSALINVTAQNVADDTIRINWQAVDSPTSFAIEHIGDTVQPIANTETSYDWAGLSPGTHEFDVYSLIGSNESVKTRITIDLVPVFYDFTRPPFTIINF